MRLEKLQYLLEINRSHSISAAAKNLNLKQTTLSFTIKTIEEELGFTIFKRIPTGVTTTSEGKILLGYVQEIINKYEELLWLGNEDEAFFSKRDIIVLSNEIISSGRAVKISNDYYQRVPGGSIQVKAFSSDRICQLISQDQANVGLGYLSDNDIQRIVESNPAYNNIQIERLAGDYIGILMSADHPLAAGAFIAPEEIDGYGTISVNKESHDKAAGRLGIDAPHASVVGDIEIVKKYIAQTENLAFIPMKMADMLCDFEKEHLVVKPVKVQQPEQIFICLIHKDNQYLCYQERLICSEIREFFKGQERQDEI